MAKQPGLLAIWTDVSAESETNFNNWYNHQHLQERSTIRGFINGRRYRAINGAPRYLALYETQSVNVLFSKPYYERLDNPTEWTQQVIPTFRNVTRATFTVQGKWGFGSGGVVASWRFNSSTEDDALLRTWLSEEILPKLVERTGIVSTHLLYAGREQAPADSDDTAEGQLRAAWHESPDWGVIVEGTSVEELRAANRQLLSQAVLREHGAKDIKTGTYRLLYGLGQFPAG